MKLEKLMYMKRTQFMTIVFLCCCRQNAGAKRIRDPLRKIGGDEQTLDSQRIWAAKDAHRRKLQSINCNPSIEGGDTVGGCTVVDENFGEDLFT